MGSNDSSAQMRIEGMIASLFMRRRHKSIDVSGHANPRTRCSASASWRGEARRSQTARPRRVGEILAPCAAACRVTGCAGIAARPARPSAHAGIGSPMHGGAIQPAAVAGVRTHPGRGDAKGQRRIDTPRGQRENPATTGPARKCPQRADAPRGVDSLSVPPVPNPPPSMHQTAGSPALGVVRWTATGYGPRPHRSTRRAIASH